MMIRKDFSGFLQQVEISFWTSLVSLMGDRRMFRRTIAVLLTAMVVVASLFLGVIIRGASSGNSEEDSVLKTSAGIRKAGLVSAKKQANTLVVFIDELRSPTPRLHGVWLLVSHPDIPNLSLLPLYPGIHHGGSSTNRSLAESFRFDSVSQIEEGFFQALHQMEIQWSDYLVLDESAVKALLEFVYRSSFDGGGSPSLVETLQLPTALDNPQASLFRQVGLAMELCNRPMNPLLQADLATITSLTAGHLRATFGALEWGRYQKYGARLTCDFPTLERQAALGP